MQAKCNIAASFQRVAVQHLLDKTQRAVQWAQAADPSIRALVVSGEDTTAAGPSVTVQQTGLL